MAKISILVALVAFVLFVSEASEAHRVGKFSQVVKDVDAAKIMIEELKGNEMKTKGMKQEVKYLSKSEEVLNKFMKAYKSHNIKDKDLEAYSKKLGKFQADWSVKASNSVVPEREVKYMNIIGQIMQDFRRRLED